ncbi:uncharacterized protein LOC143210014 [Lasioglossum baleicum]|uniref:uncharacterized protein LOC143210014 n=1 Tax=Lasioglossum baleicum TaxID=434251 RepID=UPI003FCE5D82
MTVLHNSDRSCMRFRATRHRTRRSKRLGEGRLAGVETISVGKTKNIITKREIAELLFETCTGCKKMAAIPQGAFTACKVRCNLERNTMITHNMDQKEKAGKEALFNARLSEEGREPTPMKYNSKLMNSIWGLYNRYSVHNFKKNTDAYDGVFQSFVAGLGAAFDSHAPAANKMTAAAVTKSNS